MRSRKKKWADPFISVHPGLFPSPQGLSLNKPSYLEIGCGKGDFLLGMASKQKGDYLAIEKDHSIAAVAGKKALNAGLNNVRLFASDFDELAPIFLESGYRFAKIYVNFPDPWPKLRHHKRRLTEASRLTMMAKLLDEGGEIRFKTDNADLFAYSLEQAALAKLKVLRQDDDYQLSDDDALTEYEAQFREFGIPIHYLILSKEEK